MSRGSVTGIKVGLSPSKKEIFICFNDIPLKMMKNAFCFMLKALFVQPDNEIWSVNRTSQEK